MVAIDSDLAERVQQRMRDKYGLGVGVSSGPFNVAFKRAVEGTRYENERLRDKDEYSGSAEMMVDGERVNVSFSVRPFGGDGAGESGRIVVVNMIGDDRISSISLNEAIEDAEFTAGTLSDQQP